MFKKYQHVERFGTSGVDGIELGVTYVFPKIDGTNASVWIEDGIIKAGSRNRLLSLDKDNAGFLAWVQDNENIKAYLEQNPTHRIYGEWLVPHSLKTYREEAWRRFYIFDITVDTEDSIEYIPYEIYSELLEKFGLEYIPLLVKFKNGNYDRFMEQLKRNTFLISDGAGIGEGVVIKNYDFYNRYGRQTWAKIVGAEFKEKNQKAFGSPEISLSMIEETIVEEMLTETFIKKEYAKISIDGWESKYIPKLLGVIWHEFIVEESWNIVKKYKSPKIDYKILNRFVTGKIKRTLSDLFQ